MRGVVLFPGAGSNASHTSLVAIEDAIKLDNRNIKVARVDFPYRLAGKKFPDRAPVLIEYVNRTVRQLANDWGCQTNEIVIGGRSMGGRMCSMVAAGTIDVAGLICISYPLHPPKHPDKLRTSHLPFITTPSLFISGTRDEFATVDELTQATKVIKGKVTHHWLENGRHDLKKQDLLVAQLVTDWVAEL